MMRFERKVALVTGGRSGIGLATARRFACESATVFTAQRQIDDEFESIQVDFTDAQATARTVEKVIERTGQLDVLVNNAGMMIERKIDQMMLEEWSTTMMINLTAPFLLIKTALPHLSSTAGTIVNIGSIEGLGSNPQHSAYAASKAGLHALTRSVAVEYGSKNIRCNALAPGWINTELNEAFIESMENPKQFRKYIEKIHPIGRTGTAEEVAALIAFLASEESSFITGQIFTIDGGRTAKLSLP
jgi:meso-butanediol dehydrogenase / (S,S)-butanediol dehydrogenase / diacetyl reductase